MNVTTKRARENAAANAVVEVLGAMNDVELRGCLYDDGSRDRMHDFTITCGTHKIALEVTTMANGARVGRDFRWKREAPDDWAEVPGLVGCWLAFHEGEVEGTTAIAALRTHLPVLEALERENIITATWQEYAFTPATVRPPEWEHLRALNGAGFLTLSRIDSSQLLDEHGGHACIVRGFASTRPADPNLPVAILAGELRGDHASDVHKLLAAPAVDERHLWLWVELVEGFAMLRSFETEGLPTNDLNLDGIDGVWLGRGPAAETIAGVVWLRGAGWRKFSARRNELDLGAC